MLKCLHPTVKPGLLWNDVIMFNQPAVIDSSSFHNGITDEQSNECASTMQFEVRSSHYGLKNAISTIMA